MIKLRAYLFILILFACAVSGCGGEQPGQKADSEQAAQAAATTTSHATIQLVPDTPYATTAYVYESSNPGPAVMVVGGIHGNEPAGTLAAQKFCELDLLKGSLIVIPKANQVALDANIRTLSEIGDLNRAYPGKQNGTPAERITFAIVQLMKQYQVAMVVDLHEGYAFNAIDPKSVGETILPGKDDSSVLLAMDAVTFINQQITEPHKKFSVLANPIAGSTAYYANTILHVPAFTVETSSAQPLEDRVNYGFQIVKFLVASQGIIAQ